MNIKEIVNRLDRLPINEAEACYLIEEYVKAKKGVSIKAYVEKEYGVLYLQKEYALMQKMLPYAVAYFREKLNKQQEV